MQNLYKTTLILLFFSGLMILNHQKAQAQCANGHTPGGVAYDTTVSTGSGNYSTEFKFPKFDPQNGMVTCVRLCITITGVVNLLLENNVTSPATYNITYTRRDTLTGPGLSSAMTNVVSQPYGPYNLAASDGVPFGGPDYIAIGPDTVLQAVTICHVLTDSVDLIEFYGLDSVTYTYKINAGAVVTGSGDYLFSVGTTGLVNYRLEYCYCNPEVLSAGLRNFAVTKTNERTAKLSWRAEPDAMDFYYEPQVSRDGNNFSSIGTVVKNNDNSPNYQYHYDLQTQGRYFFRVKQTKNDGKVYFSPTKYVDATDINPVKINVYPNPSNGIVGIKFDNNSAGKYVVLINNTQGQTVVRKEIEVSGNSYQQVAALQSGVYWVRVMDVTGRLSCVNQLFIK